MKYAVSLSDGTERVVEAKTPEEARAMVEAELTNAMPAAGSAALGKAEGISETPAFSRDIEIPTYLGQKLRIPVSPEQIAEAVPAAGSGIGAIFGGPLGAAAGGALGELIRQGVRKAAGYTPAAGMLQEIAGVEPDSLAATGLGVAGEALAGGLGESLMAKAAGKAPGLRESALRSYAGVTNPRSERELLRVTEKLRPIQEELPTVFTRGGLEKQAEQKAAEAGARVGSLYDVDVPSNFKPAIDRLEEMAGKQVRRPGRITVDEAGEVTQIPPDLIDPELHRAFSQRAGALKESREAAIESGKPTTLSDVFKARQAAGTRATRATQKAYSTGVQAKELQPRVQGFKAEQRALSDILHEQVPDGAQADAVFSAWKTLEKAGQKRDSGSFVERWFLARVLPGLYGTAAGAVAAKPFLTSVLWSKTKRGLANALEAGNQAEFEHLLRAAIAGATPPEE